jgi:hypothetical protein
LAPYDGGVLIIEEDWDKNEELNNCTDIFTEPERILCHFGAHISPHEYWENNQGRLGHIKSQRDIKKIRDFMYSNVKFCNNFRVSIAIAILRIFCAESWLDISAGWGDRLLAAIAENVRYVGTDPNPALHPKYKSMIETLAKEPKKYTLHHTGFEIADFGDELFDLVFSSPPFFDLEIYSNDENDSLIKYKTSDAWYHNFLLASIDKSIKHLRPNGHLVLYISEGIDTTYISRMIEYTSLRISYKGVIHYYYPKDKKSKMRSIYVWQQI